MSQAVEPTPINGCAFCGRLQRNHGMTSAGANGLHYWQEPNDELRKERYIVKLASRPTSP